MSLNIHNINLGFLQELQDVCNKYSTCLVIDHFRGMVSGVKIIGYQWEETSQQYLPVFQTNVN